jgi:hypothetical protein
LPLKGGLKTGAEFLHARARARLFVLFFWRRKKIGRQSGETDGRLDNQLTQSKHAKPKSQNQNRCGQPFNVNITRKKVGHDAKQSAERV